MPELTGIGRVLLQMSSPIEEAGSEREKKGKVQVPWAGPLRQGIGMWGRQEWGINLIRKKMEKVI